MGTWPEKQKLLCKLEKGPLFSGAGTAPAGAHSFVGIEILLHTGSEGNKGSGKKGVGWIFIEHNQQK